METCSSCKFWKQFEGGENGECRRHSPRPKSNREITVTEWPETVPDDWCGDYQQKPEPYRGTEPPPRLTGV